MDESGLLAVTIMGIAIGTQQRREVRALLEFNETVRVLLIASLFVVLGARITDAEIAAIRWQTFVFVAGLILVARPLSVLVCTLRSSLDWRAKVFAAWMAPRGIVAASISSVFALRLAQQGEPAGAELVPAVFLTVVLTLAVYGLSAAPLARRLALAEPDPQGVLILGASPLAIALGKALHDVGLRVLLADTDGDSLAAAAALDLPTHHGSVLTEHALSDLDLHGIGRLLTATANAEAAALAAMLYSSIFGRAEVYEVPVLQGVGDHQLVEEELHARRLATHGLGFVALTEQLEHGAVLRTDTVTSTSDPAMDDDSHRLPLFCVRPDGHVGDGHARSAVPGGPGRSGDLVRAGRLSTVRGRRAPRTGRRGRGCPGRAPPCATTAGRRRRPGGAWPRPGRPATPVRRACSRWPGRACRGSG